MGAVRHGGVERKLDGVFGQGLGEGVGEGLGASATSRGIVGLLSVRGGVAHPSRGAGAKGSLFPSFSMDRVSWRGFRLVPTLPYVGGARGAYRGEIQPSALFKSVTVHCCSSAYVRFRKPIPTLRA